MEERKFRMLLKNGKGNPVPWTEMLAARPDMVEAIMTADQIVNGQQKPLPVASPIAVELSPPVHEEVSTSLVEAPSPEPLPKPPMLTAAEKRAAAAARMAKARKARRKPVIAVPAPSPTEV